MKGLIPLFIGLFGTFMFSWVGLTVVPNLQIGALNPQISPDDENDIYPMPQSGMVQQGRHVYAANGCIYCHTRQVRADYAGADIERKWGVRRSAPRDYVFDNPVLLGKERMGPDLANIGKRGEAQQSPAPVGPAASPAPTGAAAPAQPPAGSANASPAASPSPNPNGEPELYSEAWHHRHLYSPRSMSPDTRDSTMPAYHFLYEKRRITGERSADALALTGDDAPPAGWEIVPTYDAKCLVAYLMAQDQTHPLKEVKSAPGAAPAAGSPAAAAAGAPAAAPPKK
jgi:cytochrome c oxidase cbb3-type subunit 2